MTTPTRGRGCAGKIRHDTRPAATEHLRHLLRLGGVRLTVYACRWCGGWHVGHRLHSRRRR